MKKIRKAVIPAAGFGTRFLPQTKAMPKEMLPIVDKPVIQYVVEEAVESGIEDIIIVTGALKRAIEDHFDVPNAELIKNLEVSGKKKLVEEIQRISEMANFIYIRQKGHYGNGTPVLSAEHVIDNEFFAVLWGDEFIYSDPPRLSQMMKVHEKYGGAVISGVRIIAEKPNPDEAPSDLATHGGYILPPEIFDILRRQKPGEGQEVWLPVAIDELIKTGYPVFACEIENGKYYDTGNKLEYMKTVVELGLEHKDINGEFRKFLKGLKL